MSQNSYREKCLEEKGERCDICGNTESIDVHHIDGDRTNDHISNLLPVCRSCHLKIHHGAPGYEEYYTRLEPKARFDQRMRDNLGETKQLSAHVPVPILRAIEEIAAGQDITRSEAVRQTLRNGLVADIDDPKLPSELKLEFRERLDEIKELNDEQVKRYQRRARRRKETVKELEQEKEELEQRVESLEEDLSFEEIHDRVYSVVNPTVDLIKWVDSIEERLEKVEGDSGKWEAESPEDSE